MSSSQGAPAYETTYTRLMLNQTYRAKLVMHRSGLLTLDPPSIQHFRIGPAFQDRITTWAKSWPQAEVATMSLNKAQAQTKRARTSRNRFWERYGFVFDYADAARRAGYSRPMVAAGLRVPSAPPERYAHIRRMEVSQHWTEVNALAAAGHRIGMAGHLC